MSDQQDEGEQEEGGPLSVVKQLVERLVETEETWSNELQMVNALFIEPSLTSSHLTASQHSILFKSLQYIFFLEEKLRLSLDSSDCTKAFPVISCYFNLCSYFQIYIDNILTFERGGGQLLKSLIESNPQFRSRVEEAQLLRPGTDLYSVLSYPHARLHQILRFCRHILEAATKGVDTDVNWAGIERSKFPTFSVLLENHIGLIYQFATGIYATESVACYQAIVHFEKEPNVESISHIFENYILANSPMEVNIPGGESKKLRKLHKESSIEELVTRTDIFDGVKRELAHMLQLNLYQLMRSKSPLVSSELVLMLKCIIRCFSKIIQTIDFEKMEGDSSFLGSLSDDISFKPPNVNLLAANRTLRWKGEIQLLSGLDLIKMKLLVCNDSFYLLQPVLLSFKSFKGYDSFSSGGNEDASLVAKLFTLAEKPEYGPGLLIEHPATGRKWRLFLGSESERKCVAIFLRVLGAPDYIPEEQGEEQLEEPLVGYSGEELCRELEDDARTYERDHAILVSTIETVGKAIGHASELTARGLSRLGTQYLVSLALCRGAFHSIIQQSVQRTVESTSSAETLFRSNNDTTRLGVAFLHVMKVPILTEVSSFQEFVEQLAAIQMSDAIFAFFHLVRTTVEAKFPEAGLHGVASFLLLRYQLPSIMMRDKELARSVQSCANHIQEGSPLHAYLRGISRGSPSGSQASLAESRSQLEALSRTRGESVAVECRQELVRQSRVRGDSVAEVSFGDESSWADHGLQETEEMRRLFLSELYSSVKGQLNVF